MENSGLLAWEVAYNATIVLSSAACDDSEKKKSAWIGIGKIPFDRFLERPRIRILSFVLFVGLPGRLRTNLM